MCLKPTSNKKSVEGFKLEKISQLRINNKVKDWQIEANTLKDELRKQNELIVLEGQRDVRYTFNNSKPELQDTKGNPLKFLASKFNELKTKEMTVTTTYNYIFSYDLKDIEVDVQDDSLCITLQKGHVKLKPIAEITDNRVG